MRKANEGRWLANPLFGYMERVKKQVWDRNKTSSFPINSYQVGGGVGFGGKRNGESGHAGPTALTQTL